MRYYVHYLHFSDFCPHLCHNVYQNVSTVVRSSLLPVVGMLNLTLYFAYRGALVKKVAVDIYNTQKFIHKCPQGHMVQWIKASVRSSDIPKECEFNTR